MSRLLLATLLLTACVSTAAAQPTFEAVKFTHGIYGPERPATVFHRQDEVVLHYMLNDLKTNDDGQIDVQLENKLIDPKGTVAFRNGGPIKTELLLGGGSVAGVFALPLDHPYLPDGEWTIEVTATDNVAKKSATLKRQWTFKTNEFAMVRMNVARDDQFKVPARLTSAVACQPLFFRNKLVGFAREKGEMKIDVEMTLLDAAGNPVRKAKEIPCRHQLEGEPGPLEAWDFSGSFIPNRAGDFVLRLTAHDRVAKTSSTIEIPLHVENP